MANFLAKFKDVARYLPYVWLGAKVLWQMYKARVRQEGFRNALERERANRIKAERDLDLSNRMDDDLATRVERLKREAREREDERDN